MQKFKYRYESIKNIKESLEKKIQKELAIIELEIQKYKMNIDEIENERKNINIKGETKVKVSEIKAKINYDSYLEDLILDIKKKIELLENNKKEKIEELIQKSKEHKIFKTLGEHHYNIFKNEMEKLIQNEMDELAIKNFIRGNN